MVCNFTHAHPKRGCFIHIHPILHKPSLLAPFPYLIAHWCRIGEVDVDLDQGYTSAMKFVILELNLFRRMLGFFLVTVFFAYCSCVYAEPDDEDWWSDDLEEKALSVNEGDLVFLPPQPHEKVHHHHNRIILHTTSLLDGWITLHQCHEQIDAVHEAQIVYHKGRVRDLSIDFSRNIGRVWVEGHTIQLRNILHDAALCITASSKALNLNPDGTYTLNNGPFMRRFLDGYYPMHVTLDIALPANCLRVEHMSPQQQDGFEVRQLADKLSIDTWFEGRLLTAITFSYDNNNDAKDNCSL